MGHFGKKDTNPSPKDMQDQFTELHEQGLSVEFFEYDADHGFSCSDPTMYVQHPADLSWYRSVKFFSTMLGVPVEIATIPEGPQRDDMPGSGCTSGCASMASAAAKKRKVGE